MMEELKPCPCGQTPKVLGVCDNGQGNRWAVVVGDCCGSWEVEFRTRNHALDSAECYAIACEAWNDAPRSTDTPEAL